MFFEDEEPTLMLAEGMSNQLVLNEEKVMQTPSQTEKTKWRLVCGT